MKKMLVLTDFSRNAEYATNAINGTKKTAMSRVLFGGNSSAVMEKASCPVLIVPEGAVDITGRKDSERMKQELVNHEHLLRTKRQEHKKQKELLETFVKAQEDERVRIAEQLHNGLGQMLYAVKLKLSLVNSKSSEEEVKIKAIADVNKLLSECITECRRTAHHLLPRILNDFGLRAGINELGRQFRPAIEFKFQYESLSPIKEEYYEIVIYRTVQELLMNIVKHAEATIATCKVKIDSGMISIIVEDNGKGLKPGVHRKKGIGLSSIKSRIAQMDGTFDISSETQKGTRVTITLPRRLVEDLS